METSTLEQPALIKQSSKKSNKITLTAFRPKTQMACTLRPLEKAKGKLYTGQGKAGIFEALTPKEREDLGERIIDRNSSVTVTDGMVIDLDDPIDAANWEWMKLHPYIAADKKSGSSNNDAVFYVNDPEKDAVERIKVSADKDTARYKVRQLSHSQMEEASRVLGLSGAKEFSAEYILGWLLDQSEITPKSVLTAIDPEYADRNKAKVLFNEAMRYQIIKKTVTGTLEFGNNKMGHNEESVLTWLLDPANKETVKVIAQRIIEAKKV